MPALHPGRGQVEQRHPRRVGLRGRGGGGPARSRWRPAGAPASPSRRRCHRWTRPRRRGRRRGWYRSHQVRVDSLEAGWTTREMISARARSRAWPAGPSRAGRPSSRAMACTAATWPCGSDRVMVTVLGGGDQLLALEPGVDQVDDVAGQRGQVGHGLVLDLAAVAVGAAQVGRGVVLAAALLVDVPGLADSDYVNFPGIPRHNQIITVRLDRSRWRHAEFSDYAPCPDLTETAVQDAIPTEVRQLRPRATTSGPLRAGVHAIRLSHENGRSRRKGWWPRPRRDSVIGW